MKLIHLFGIVAMVPAALNAAPASARSRLFAPLCTGDGLTRTISVPVGPQDIPGREQPGCCAKGCHAGGERKRAKRCC